MCVQGGWLYNEGNILSKYNYDALKKRGFINVIRRGCKGTPALVEFDTMKMWIKERILEMYGNPHKLVKQNLFVDKILPDAQASNFYRDYLLSDGRNLPSKIQREYIANVQVLNTIQSILNTIQSKRKSLGGSTKGIWGNINKAVNNLDTNRYPHTLPTNERRLKQKYNSYLKNGLTDLIHKGYSNDNSRKVTIQIESLIISLYCLPNKPYSSSVHDMYLQFLGGEIEVFDIKTGELFNREEFYTNGSPVTISEATVWNYVKDPRNELIIKKSRNGAYDFNHKVRPHVHRTAPNYSMSKITLDDRDIMHTRLHDGSKVMAYYAFDVMSTAMIGISHSKTKDHKLYIDCIRNMFRFTTSLDLGVPMEMEVEHHLVKDFKDGLMKAGNIFPFVRWCNPSNSQEKRAERFIQTKKYGVEKNNNQNVGRHYSKLDSNRITRQKIFDAQNDNYKFAKSDYDTIVANELQEQNDYNNQLHPNQKKYKGMTRMDVFIHHVNPNLPKFNKSQLAKYIGNHTETSIRRSQYVTVQYGKYELPSPELLNRLAPNNFNVDAYYLPSEDNQVTEVFIYQNNEFICECKPVSRFNEATAEQTDVDSKGYTNATKYISTFDKMVKDDTTTTLQKVSIMKKNNTIIDVTPEVIPTIEPSDAFEFKEPDTEYQINRAINAI